MPTSSFSLSPATRKPLAAASPQDVAFPHRFRWFGRTLPPLAFQRQQCGGDGSARSLEAPPLFRKIRAAKALGWEHTGGCTLFEHRKEIEKMVV